MKADIFHAFVALLKQTKPSIAIQHHPGQTSELMDLGDEGPVSQLMSQVRKIFAKKTKRELGARSFDQRAISSISYVSPDIAMLPTIPSQVRIAY